MAAQVALLALVACGGGGVPTPPAPAPAPAPTPVPPPPATPVTPAPPAPYASCSPAGVALAQATQATNSVCMLTTQGEIVIELYADKAPQTVANFLKYVNEKFYANTLYHRVIDGFVVQGGGYDTSDSSNEKKATYAAIPLESNNGLYNYRGTIAMARTSLPDSATTQFYFNLANNVAGAVAPATNLDYDPTQSGKSGYTVFGKVIAGMDAVDKIAKLAKSDTNPAMPKDTTVTYWMQQVK